MIDATALTEMICAELENMPEHEISDEAVLTAVHVFNGQDGTPPLLSVA